MQGVDSSISSNLCGRKRPHVLLVEDHVDSAQVLARLLSAQLDVEVAASCAEALAAVARAPFDLFLIDIGLPDGDGCDLLQALVRIAPAPAVALSGYGMDYDKARGLAAGFLTYVVKPCGPQELFPAIWRGLARSKASRRNSAAADLPDAAAS